MLPGSWAYLYDVDRVTQGDGLYRYSARFRVSREIHLTEFNEVWRNLLVVTESATNPQNYSRPKKSVHVAVITFAPEKIALSHKMVSL